MSKIRQVDDHLSAMELRFQKRTRSSLGDCGRDRLSEMPDEVLVHILSYMPILDAVRTVLLRCFGNLWTLVPTLELDLVDRFIINNKREVYSDDWFHFFVWNVLILHKRPSINKFRLRVNFRKHDESLDYEMKMWLRSALGRQATEIIFIDESKNFQNSSFLPDFASQFLVKLELRCCKIGARLKVNLPFLKKLLLDRCFMGDEEFERFISGCPSLQELGIIDPSDIDKLSFSFPDIDKFSLVLPYNHRRENPVLLDCPNVKTLHLDIHDGLHINDVSSLCDIYVKSILRMSFNPYDDILIRLKLFYGKLDGAEVIHLSHQASSQFLNAIPNLYLLRHKWKRVVLGLDKFCQDCLVGVCHLIRSLTYLEELTVYTAESFKASPALVPVEVLSSYVTPQLKTVTLHGYGKTWKSQLPIVEFLLGSVTLLEKLVIVTVEDRLKATEKREFVKRVSSLPRASKRARVLFA